MKQLLFLVCALFCALVAAQQYNVPFSPPPVAGGGGDAATDWTSSMHAVYLFEESSGPSADEVGSQSLTWSGSTAQDTTNYIQGSSSVYVDSSTSDYLYGATSTHWNVTGDLTIGFFIRSQSGDDAGTPFFAWDQQGDGPYFTWSRSSAAHSFTLDSTTVSWNDHCSPYCVNNDTWYHFAGSWGSSSQVVTTYINGHADDTTGSKSSRNTYNSNGWRQMPRSSALMDASFDEMFIDDAEWTADELHRAISCGIDGKLCVCDSGTPANYLTCTTDADCDVSGGDQDIAGACATTTGECRGRYDSYTGSPWSWTSLAACNASAP